MIIPLLILGAGVVSAAALKRKASGATAAVQPVASNTPVVPAPPLEAPGLLPGGIKVPDLSSLIPAGVGSTLATVGAGLALDEGLAAVVGAVGGNEAEKDLTRLTGIAGAAGILVGKGAEEAAKAIGLDKGGQQASKEIAGIGTVLAPIVGAPAFLAIAEAKLVGEGISAVVGAVAGEKAEQDLRNAVSQLDPTKTGSLANQVVETVTAPLQAIFGVSDKVVPLDFTKMSDEDLDKMEAAYAPNLQTPGVKGDMARDAVPRIHAERDKRAAERAAEAERLRQEALEKQRLDSAQQAAAVKAAAQAAARELAPIPAPVLTPVAVVAPGQPASMTVKPVVPTARPVLKGNKSQLF